MKDLIKALTIIQNYLLHPEHSTTSCDEGIFYVYGIDLNKINVDTIHELYNLGFILGTGNDDIDICHINYSPINDIYWNELKVKLGNCFRSYKYGSC